jgi:hypothetical protein
MAFESAGIDLSYIATEDLSTHQYRFVVQSDNDHVRMADSASEWELGILQNAPASGEVATVRLSGVSKLVAGSGGLARGAAVALEYVGAADNGKGIATTTNSDIVRARCIYAAGSEDDVATVLLTDAYYHSGS